MTEVIMIGTGVPEPNPNRQGSCIAIIIDGKPILLDSGRGALTQLVRAGIDPAQVEQVFLSHLHYDHIIGLPDLLLGSWMVGRSTGVEVFGPVGTTAFVEGLLEAFKIDIQGRKATGTNSRFEVSTREIDEGPVWEMPAWKLEAVRVVHIPGSLGFRVDTEDRSIVFSGDTRPCPALVELARDCDLLIHEVLFSPELEQTGAPAGRHREFIHPEWANRVRHTKPFQVGKIAAEANAKKLVLTHLWSEKEEDRLKAEVAAHYSGEIVVARDLMRV